MKKTSEYFLIFIASAVVFLLCMYFISESTKTRSPDMYRDGFSATTNHLALNLLVLVAVVSSFLVGVWSFFSTIISLFTKDENLYGNIFVFTITGGITLILWYAGYTYWEDGGLSVLAAIFWWVVSILPLYLFTMTLLEYNEQRSREIKSNLKNKEAILKKRIEKMKEIIED